MNYSSPSSSYSSSSCSNIQWKYDVFLSFRGEDVFLSFRGEDTRNNFTDHLYTALDQKGIYTSSSSCSNIQWKYDVFLSFRGEDTRNNFTDHLYTALDHKGIYTYDKRLERGKEISSELLEAVEESRFSVIILSKNYASSTWCLDELAKIVDCMETKKQIVLPIFYDVDPSVVRKQTEEFKKSFDKHEEDFKDDKVKVKSSEAKLIKDVVDDVSRRLDQNFSSVVGDFVGICSRLKEIYDVLELELDHEVRFIGICGMGGIGKTTVVRVLYNQLSDKYEGSCFLANVREVSEKKGLVHLQKLLISKVLKEETNLNICDVQEGINLIRRQLCRKKVFIVLDDVDNQIEQLETLVGKHNWFGSGSIIIVTTRDEHVLVSHGITNIHKVKALDESEARELFYSKAFKNGQPTDDHEKLLKHVLNYTSGLPLALEVLGSFLCDKSVNEWESALNSLQEYPNEKIIQTLQISYDGLKQNEKDIFLDVACFFKGKDNDRVTEILKSCSFHPDIGIRRLVEKSLITIIYNKLWMHDLLQEMAWEIGSTYLDGKSFSNLRNLRLLKISSKVHLLDDLEYLSDELRFLKWCEYPLNSLPSGFLPQNLFELDMCYSKIKYLWKGMKQFAGLKTIKLSHFQNLIRTPDFTGVPNLEKLELEDCTGLLEVHQSVGFLQRLTVLNLRNCRRLAHFPRSVRGLKSLMILNLSDCSKLDRLPEDLEEMKCLEELDVGGTAIRQLPSSIGHLTTLKKLSFRECTGQPSKTCRSLVRPLLQKRNPNSSCLQLPPLLSLCSLQELVLRGCNLSEGTIPDDLDSLALLEQLDLSINSFVSLPKSISRLSKLKFLCLEKCRKLQSLPELPREIMVVGAENCSSLEVISSALKGNTSPNVTYCFLNCFKLVENQGRKNSLAVLLLKRQLQVCLFLSLSLSIHKYNQYVLENLIRALFLGLAYMS
ncbi:hypothetical protein ACOSP7_009061 [Xanthoceras sorbifolium]